MNISDLNRQIDEYLASLPRPNDKAFHNPAQINTNCMYCGVDVPVSAYSETPDCEGVYPPVVCDRCAAEEIEAIENDEAYAQHHNKMQDLRERGVVILEDHRHDRK